MKSIYPKQSLFYSMLIITALLWSTGGILIKGIIWNPMAIAGTRSFIAGIIIWFALGKPKLTWSIYQIGGAICYSATVILYVLANKMTAAANVVLLMYTAPIYIIIFGPWFLKEKFAIRELYIVIIVIIGIIIFFFENLSPEGLIGNILATISGLTFAWMTLFLRRQKRKSPSESVLLGNFLTAIICLPFFFCEQLPDYKGIVMLTIMGVFQLGISYVLYARAIQKVRAIDAVLITSLEPILNPIWVFLIYTEYPGKWTLVGGFIVMTTILFHAITEIRYSKKK
ncbi:MAG: EamA family transporter [Candidatus Marinimicrobia bacterium]|nr:EamA family transporter [Candidatus Neomarinimicrobiota bacterium]|tara:strand:- start:1047 stop:1898 length:852 start_codon:yes stop_codon:yes gene_type:complete